MNSQWVDIWRRMSRASGSRLSDNASPRLIFCAEVPRAYAHSLSQHAPLPPAASHSSPSYARNVVPVHRERISNVQMWRSRGIKALAGSLPCLPSRLPRQENEVAATASGATTATATATLTAANGRPPLRGGPNRSQGCRVTIRGSFQLTAAFRQFEHNNIARGFRRTEWLAESKLARDFSSARPFLLNVTALINRRCKALRNISPLLRLEREGDLRRSPR